MTMAYPRSPKPACFALGRLKAGTMNKTEAAYAARLEAQRQAGDVLWWAFECLKLRLADSTFYSPDFIVLVANGTLEAHEVKGYWQDDARAKIKIAAALFPIRFRAFQKQGGTWLEEDFG
jgi:hypothetical protein